MNLRRTEAESASLRAIWTRDLLDSQPEVECEELVQLAAAICGTPAGLVTLLDERHQWYRASAHLKLGETPREVAFCAHAIRENGLFVVKDALMDLRFANNPLVVTDPAIRFFAGVGLFTSDGEPLGTLSVVDMVPKILAPEQVNALEVLGRQVSVRLEAMVQRKALVEAIAERDRAAGNLRASEELFRAFMNASPFLSYIKDAAGRLLFYNRAFAQRFGVSEYAWLGRTDDQLWARKLPNSVRRLELRKLAVTDELTGLRNRRSFEERLVMEFSMAQRRKRELSVLLIDVDNFKLINDRGGHAAGDEVLRRLGMILRTTVRLPDLPARYGGEEFVVLLPESGEDSAMGLARRVMQRVATEDWENEPLTISVGMAAMNESLENGFQLVELADEALYAAKRAGKNRVMVYSG